MGRRPLNAGKEALLREVLERRAPRLLPLIDGVVEGRSLSADEVEELRNAMINETTAFELEESGEPTRRGLLLDDLVDVVGHLSDEEPT